MDALANKDTIQLSDGRYSIWTVEFDQRLQVLMEKGYTSGRVAMMLGITRHQAIGRAWRKNYVWRSPGAKVGPPRLRKKTVAQKRELRTETLNRPFTPRPSEARSKATPRMGRPLEPEQPPMATAFVLERPIAAADGQAVLLVDAKPGSCRYPLWHDREDAREVCGAQKLEDQAYCKTHFLICTIPYKKRTAEYR